MKEIWTESKFCCYFSFLSRYLCWQWRKLPVWFFFRAVEQWFLSGSAGSGREDGIIKEQRPVVGFNERPHRSGIIKPLHFQAECFPSCSWFSSRSSEWISSLNDLTAVKAGFLTHHWWVTADSFPLVSNQLHYKHSRLLAACQQQEWSHFLHQAGRILPATCWSPTCFNDQLAEKLVARQQDVWEQKVIMLQQSCSKVTSTLTSWIKTQLGQNSFLIWKY